MYLELADRPDRAAPGCAGEELEILEARRGPARVGRPRCIRDLGACELGYFAALKSVFRVVSISVMVWSTSRPCLVERFVKTLP